MMVVKLKRNLKIIIGILISIVGIMAVLLGIDFTNTMINFLFITLFGFEFVQWFMQEDKKKEEEEIEKDISDNELVEKAREMLSKINERGLLEEIMWFDENTLNEIDTGIYENYTDTERKDNE
jgi:large-conductance mechanosensitive channel